MPAVSQTSGWRAFFHKKVGENFFDELMRRAVFPHIAFSPSRFFLKRQFDAIYIKAPTHKRAGFCFFQPINMISDHTIFINLRQDLLEKIADWLDSHFTLQHT